MRMASANSKTLTATTTQSSVLNWETHFFIFQTFNLFCFYSGREVTDFLRDMVTCKYLFCLFVIFPFLARELREMGRIDPNV